MTGQWRLCIVAFDFAPIGFAMPSGFGNKLVIAISSRALFDLDDSHQEYQDEGLAA